MSQNEVPFFGEKWFTLRGKMDTLFWDIPIHTHTHIYIYMYIYIYIRIYTSIDLCMYVCTYIPTYVCMYLRMYWYVCMYMYMYVSMRRYVYMYIHVCVCERIYSWIFALTDVCVLCMCVCKYDIWYTHIMMYVNGSYFKIL